MDGYKNLAHSRYDCKYHVVSVPKFRKQSLFGKIRAYLKGVLHELARQKGCKIISGHMAKDHIHMCISIPPKYAVSETIGYLKGKSAIFVARQFGGKQRNFSGENFGRAAMRCQRQALSLTRLKSTLLNKKRLTAKEMKGSFSTTCNGRF